MFVLVIVLHKGSCVKWQYLYFSFSFIRENYALYRETFALIRESYMLYRESLEYFCERNLFIRESNAKVSRQSQK